MKITQTVLGKFHHFDLARELHRRGVLEAIFSSYPWHVLRHEGVPRDIVRTFPWLHTPLIAAWRAGWRGKWIDRDLAWAVAESLDAYAARRLPDCDIHVALSSAGLKTGAIAKRRGSKYICDRGSSHIRYQNTILADEFRAWRQDFRGIDPRIIAKEEAEYALADCITVPSEFARLSFIEMGIRPEKLRKVPYGVNLARFAKVADPPDDVFEVLFVGQISFRKGVPYLLEAFTRLAHPRKRLRLVGAMQPDMAAFLTGRRIENVELVGRVPQPKLKEFMSASHVMVLPSIEEGLALVQGQALACGCPLISSTNTGATDLITHEREGFIVPIRDAAAITQRLTQLADDPLLRSRMSEAALQRVASIGGSTAYGDRFVETCQELHSGAAPDPLQAFATP